MSDIVSSVSVVMSIYRPNESYLAEQLRSIDEQDYPDFEVVVYNDCPEDQSWEAFCRQHCANHPLRYYHGERNLGYVKAFERLVGLATGDYICFSDQDDRWLPGRLSRAAEYLDEGYLLTACDYQIIDGDGNVVVESWQNAHPKDMANAWRSGDHITDKAAFTCFSVGMAIMMHTNVAQQLMPFPEGVGHDQWLMLGASALGPCAKIETPLVSYRRYGSNVSGTLRSVNCKDDWYRTRTDGVYETVQEFARRFPRHPDVPRMLAFAQARKNRNLRNIWKYRNLAPLVAYFELCLRLTPDWAFRGALAAYRLPGTLKKLRHS